MSRDYTVYWVVYVTLPGASSRQEGEEPVKTPPYSKRFEFRGELAEEEAIACHEKAKKHGLESRITKARIAAGKLPARA